MSLATGSNYDDDLGHGYIRRPISVAQLMEREGYRPAARSRATRRALTGVAAGAVLALGAVVGSLLLNHTTGNTAGDTLAAGSSADIVLGGHQQAAAVSPQAATQNGTKAISNVGKTPVAPNPGRVVTGQPVRTVTTPATGSTQSQPGGTAQTPAPAQSPVTPQSGTSTPTNPTPTAPTGAKPTTTAPTVSGGPSGGGTPVPSSSSSSNGGLLGAVTGTLTGTLNSVTQPVFTWFG